MCTDDTDLVYGCPPPPTPLLSTYVWLMLSYLYPTISGRVQIVDWDMLGKFCHHLWPRLCSTLAA